VLGGVVDLELIRQTLGLSRLEDLIERAGRVGVENIHDQHDLLSVGIQVIDQVFDDLGEVHRAALIQDGHLAPAAQRLSTA
jgi:hypothetical protein